MDDDADIEDGLVPFADRRFARKEMIEGQPPIELSELLEKEISARGLVVPTEDFLELRCVSKEFATATFMVRRGFDGALTMLIPNSAKRRPS